MSSLARSGRKLLETRRRESQKHRRGAAVSFLIPGHALHEKGLQRLIGVVTLVSSQEQRGRLVPGQTGYQLAVNRGFYSSIGLNGISLVRASRGSARRSLPHRLGVREFVFSWAKSSVVGVLCCPSPPGPTVPPGPRTDPLEVCSGFGIDRFLITAAEKCGFGAKSGPKGAYCSGRAHHRNLQRDDYRHINRRTNYSIIPRETTAGELEDEPLSASHLSAAESLDPPVNDF